MSDVTLVAECPLLESPREWYLLEDADLFDEGRGDLLAEGDVLRNFVLLWGNSGRTGTQDFIEESVPTGGRKSGRSETYCHSFPEESRSISSFLSGEEGASTVGRATALVLGSGLLFPKGSGTRSAVFHTRYHS